MGKYKLIVGLGNPEERFNGTRHNFGFRVVDKAVSTAGLTWCVDATSKALVACDGHVVFVKPCTFMNLVGECVGKLADRLGVSANEIIIVHDDTAFKLGTMKLKHGGSAHGHNGLASIALHLGSEDTDRLRLGIGRPEGVPMISHVLGKFSDTEDPVVDKVVEAAASALVLYEMPFDKLASKYNGSVL